MIFYNLTNLIYTLIPECYHFQLKFFNGNHFYELKKRINHIPHQRILELGSGTSPMLDVFSPKRYVGIDIDEKFIKIAKKLHKKKGYDFIVQDATKIQTKESFDMILLSHTTHHFNSTQLKTLLRKIRKIKFKYLLIYDGKPIGPLAPFLSKLDLGTTFRELEEFYPFLEKHFKIIHSEIFYSNRPFYKYPLLIIKKK